MRLLLGLLALALLVLVGSSALLTYVLVVDEGVAPRPAPAAGADGTATGGPSVETRDRPLDVLVAAAGDASAGAAWEARLRRLGHGVRVGAAPGALDAPPGVIVAPRVAALDPPARDAVLAAVERGAGLVVIGGLVPLRADGTPDAAAPLARLFRARPLDPADAAVAGASRFVVLRGGGPLAVGLPAGARIALGMPGAPLAVPRAAAAAEWAQWHLLPLERDGRPVRPTAVALARHGRGRAVWLNGDPDAVVADGVSPSRMDALVANALRWAGQRPAATLERWPGGARIAILVGLDTEEGFAAAEPVARAFAAAGAPFTAFVLSGLADRYAGTVAVIADAAEIASHTHDHRPLAGRDEAAQRAELERSRNVLARLAGARVEGLRPPEELSDDATLAALAGAGYTYLAGRAAFDRAEPALLAAGEGSIVALPRVPRDDYQLVEREGRRDEAALWGAMRDDLLQLRRLGGLHFFSFHTQFAAEPWLRAAVARLLEETARPDVWRATGRDIAAWWRARAATSLRLDAREPGRLALEITAGAPVDTLGVRVHLPDGWDRPALRAVEGAAPVLARPGVPGRALRLEYRKLRVGERRRTVLERRP
jgi:peptidoglycan/xylan/chitin deacetylase (PgdA/CDA1 family)